MYLRYGTMAALCALLVACGDDGGGSSGGGTSTPTPTPATPTPTPTSTPVPLPTPTPTRTPTYTSYDALTGDQSFRSSCAGLQQSSPQSTTPATAFGDGYAIAYGAAAQAYTITGNGQTLVFGTADADPNPPSSGKSYIKTTSGRTERFRIFGASLGYARPLLLQTYTTGGTPVSYFCVIGVPTLVSDAPAAATYTYTMLIGGALSDASGGTTVSYSLQPTTVTFSVDLARLTVASTLHLIGQTAAGAQVDLGTYTGSGTVDATTGSITGSFTAPGRDTFGFFGGTFFGPQGSEVALSYNLTSRATGTATTGVNSAGYFYGAR